MSGCPLDHAGATSGVRLWLVAATPPAAWAVHLVVAYSAEEVICSQSLRTELLGIPLLEAAVALLTVVLTGVTAWAGLAGYRLWSRRRDLRVEPPVGRDGFVGALAAALAPLFAAAMLFAAATIVFLSPCADV